MTPAERAAKYIPSGVQTYSKAPSRYPEGAPQFIARATGAYVVDVEGREYLDYVSGLGAIILGHQDPDVDNAVRDQLNRGICFPTATEIEGELAELLCSIIPCAEMVRFAKNGVDATSAAVRIAKAFTGRESIVSMGYHGYADWTVAWQNPKGVPGDCRAHLIEVPYGNLRLLEKALYPFQTRSDPACLIMEPVVNADPILPPDGYLQGVRDLCTEYGVILIFDELVTGFRMHIGGAQTLYDVTPDLACFGKAMANGYPLSAVLGRRDLMNLLDEGVFFSTTFGGEALSLAASLATIRKLQATDALTGPGSIKVYGESLTTMYHELRDKHGLTDATEIVGYPQRPVARWRDERQSAIFGKVMVANGMLFQGYFNLTWAMGTDEMVATVRAMDAGFKAVKDAS